MAIVIKAGADDAKKYWLDEGRGDKGGFIREGDSEANSRGLVRWSKASRSSIATPISPSRRICGPATRRPEFRGPVKVEARPGIEPGCEDLQSST